MDNHGGGQRCDERSPVTAAVIPEVDSSWVTGISRVISIGRERFGVVGPPAWSFSYLQNTAKQHAQ